MNDPSAQLVMFGAPPPAWALRRPKPYWQVAWDLVGAPLRMALLPDTKSEALHLTSLRAERLGVVLPELRGRVLDIGAGDNVLVRLHQQRSTGADKDASDASVGLDLVDWGGGCVIVPDCRTLPFGDASFDTVMFVACLNHIPERVEAIAEARRVLRPGGRIVVTMISKLVGDVGHAIWWYSEDKHRQVADGEVMGMDPADVERLLREAGFAHLCHTRFVYGLNHMFIATRVE